MRYILIPVKELTRAKQRLAPLVSPEERARLARLMLERTFDTAARARGVDRLAVVTLSRPAAELAGRYGMEVVAEAAQTSESASVDFASRELERRGAEFVLRLAIDTPLMTPGDVEEIVSHRLAAPSAVIVPSYDGTGTNAILRSPPCAFRSRFGEGSLAKHLAEAGRSRARSKVVYLPRIALDIDGPEDLAVYMKLGAGSEIYDYLERLKMEERLEKYFASGDAPSRKTKAPPPHELSA